jgi:hypothetical protein
MYCDRGGDLSAEGSKGDGLPISANLIDVQKIRPVQLNSRLDLTNSYRLSSSCFVDESKRDPLLRTRVSIMPRSRVTLRSRCSAIRL